MHTRQSSAKADDCGYARPFAVIKKKEMKTKIIIISIVSFFILNNNFGQIDIQDNWINENLSEMKTKNKEDELKNISKLSMIYYPSSRCIDCKETIIEVKENGIFTIKHESTDEGFDIHQGILNKYGIQKFQNLARKSLVHKYPKHDFSNGGKFVSTDAEYFHFSIHVNGEIRKSAFMDEPPNSKKLIEFLLNIGEEAELKKIDDYQFEIK